MNILMLIPTYSFVDSADFNMKYMSIFFPEFILFTGLAIIFFWEANVKKIISDIFIFALVLTGLFNFFDGVFQTKHSTAPNWAGHIDYVRSCIMYIVFAAIFFKMAKVKDKRSTTETTHTYLSLAAFHKIINIILLGGLTFQGLALLWHSIKDLAFYNYQVYYGLMYLFSTFIFLWVSSKKFEIYAKGAARILLRWIVDQKKRYSALDNDSKNHQ